MLSGAVVADPRRCVVFLDPGSVDVGVESCVPATCQNILLGSGPSEHVLRSGDVAWFTAVGSAHQGNIGIVEGISFRSPGFEDRERLERLGCGAGESDALGISYGVEELSGCVDDGGVDAVGVFDDACSVCGEDVFVVGLWIDRIECYGLIC